MTGFRVGLSLIAGYALVTAYAPACFAQGTADAAAKIPALMQAKLADGVNVDYIRVPLEKFDVRVLAARVPIFEKKRRTEPTIEPRALGKRIFAT